MVHVNKVSPLHTLYIPIHAVVGLLERHEQSDLLHLSGTREEVSNILLQNKQALQQLLWLQHQSPIGHFSGYYGYSISPIGLGTHRNTSVGRPSYPSCLQKNDLVPTVCVHATIPRKRKNWRSTGIICICLKTVHRTATYTSVDTRTFFLQAAWTMHVDSIPTV